MFFVRKESSWNRCGILCELLTGVILLFGIDVFTDFLFAFSLKMVRVCFGLRVKGDLRYFSFILWWINK